MLERNIERFFAKQIKAAGGIALKLISPGFSGLPDRLVLLPKGRIYFVELKAPGKSPRPLQLAAHRILLNLGFNVLTIDSRERVKEFIREVVKYEV